ncbi:MAG TPA: LytTR family DNA-binding domain-containing protein [Terriglobales bacterium]|nr:LytTR family DNA-binding domain-containing protein [Terriglobales bacterium]
MATQMSAYVSLSARQSGIRVTLCEPDPAIRAQIRTVIDSDPLLVLAGESNSWSGCRECLQESVPELLIVRSELIPIDWQCRHEFDSFLPVVIAVRTTLAFATGDRQCNELRFPADAHAIKLSLDRAVRDIYDRKAKQLLYLVERYVSAATPAAQYNASLQAERDGLSVDLRIDSILAIVAARKHVSVFSTDGHFRMREPIHRLAGRLDPRMFVRIHRSVIINVRHIDRSHTNLSISSRIVLSDGSNYRIGPNYREAVAAALSEAA